MRIATVGCGCTMLIVEEAEKIQDATVRCLDYCGDTDGLRIGRAGKMSEYIMDHNLTPDVVSDLTPVQLDIIIDEFASLVTDGHKYRELSRLLKSATRDQ